MDPFSIVFICSGNRFRSVLAEAFVRRLTRELPVKVESFGTLDVGSLPPLDEANRLAEWCGIDLSQHRTRVLGEPSLADVDLLLGFEQEHARAAVVDAEASLERAFMFREFVSLLDGPPPEHVPDVVERGRLAVRRAAARRAQRTVSETSHAIRDPFGGPWRTYRSTAEEVRDLSVSMVRGLFGLEETSALPPLPRDLARSAD